MGNKALFLDRDGVVNVEKNYVHKREDFEFIPGIFELCDHAQSLGFMLIIVTNQAGIGRGFYTEDQFLKLTSWMCNQFSAKGISITHVYYCPYHPTAGLGKYRRDSFDRKPKPGMLLKAQCAHDLDLSSSILIGDRQSDIEAGLSANVGHNVLLDITSTHTQEGLIYGSLQEISKWITRVYSLQTKPA